MRKNGEVERRKKEMGIVTKEGYERKREWAANRMNENRELTNDELYKTDLGKATDKHLQI